MEATIRTNDSSAFYSVVQFLKSLHFTVEAKQEMTISNKRPIGLCKGEFTVPDNFNEPLPQQVISTFYQR